MIFWAIEEPNGKLLCGIDGIPFLYMKRSKAKKLCDEYGDGDKPVKVKVERVME